METTKKQLKCRADGCAETFGYHAARIKHEKKDHPNDYFGTVRAKPKRKRAKASRAKRTPARSEVRVTLEPKSKESVVPVVLNFCPFCARALPNAHLIQSNGRH